MRDCFRISASGKREVREVEDPVEGFSLRCQNFQGSPEKAPWSDWQPRKSPGSKEGRPGGHVGYSCPKTRLETLRSYFRGVAERNGRDFFEQLVRGRQRKRKKLFSEEEWFLMLNWDEWNDALAPDLLKLHPLKFWTDESVLALLERRFQELKLGLSGLRTKRIRLGLKQVKPAKIIGVFPVDGQPGFVKIESAD
jgi:hypothetical protein